MTALLRIDGLSRRFGGVLALNDVSLTLAEGEIVGLIGPNGAGKTTLVNVVTGVYRPSKGSVTYDNVRIDGMSADKIARRGVARTFQIVQPFPRMTVVENVAAAALFAGHTKSITVATARALEHLQFCGLSNEAHILAGSLTLAGRKRLELAKGLALRPKLLFLDEVNAGLNPAEIDQALNLIRSIAEQGVTIVLIEHLMKLVMRACSRIVVLHHGELVADGVPDKVVKDPAVISAYLGRRFAQLPAEALP